MSNSKAIISAKDKETSNLYLNENLFVIPDGKDKFLLYIPDEALTLMVNGAIVRALQDLKAGAPGRKIAEPGLIEKMVECKIVQKTKFIHEKKPAASETPSFDPKGVSLFLTTGCNMRCIYCYSRGGAEKKYLPWTYAKPAIDYLFENAIKNGHKMLYTHFHGGGEITTAIHLLKKCTGYIRECSKMYGIAVNIEAGFNGVMSKHALSWVLNNIDGATVSLDGLPSVQNYQRPLSNGKESYRIVSHTLKMMDEAGFRYGVRSTVTHECVEHLADSVEDIFRNFKPKAIQVEPVFLTGRALEKNLQEIDPRAFVEQYRSAKQRLGSFSKILSYSGARLGTYTDSFCKALTGSSFCITPHGHLTACYEVTDPSDSRSRFFFFGGIDRATGKVNVNFEKIGKLRKLKDKNIELCRNCFCKWHCAGDCPAKTMPRRNLRNHGQTTRCTINRELTKDQLRESLVPI